MFQKQQKWVLAFSALYLIVWGIYFLTDFNFEFMIYIGVILVLFAGVFGTLKYTRFPVWMLWMFSIWGLMHVLGGMIQTPDGVLFAYRIFPFIDRGWEFYILKYDQVVHFYLYGLVALMAQHLLAYRFKIPKESLFLALAAILISVGISSLNEIMEFLIAISLADNGVGGYENTMLDIIFNLSGAVVAVGVMRGLKLILKEKIR